MTTYWVCKECKKAEDYKNDPDNAWAVAGVIKWMKKHAIEHERLQEEEKMDKEKKEFDEWKTKKSKKSKK